MSNRFWPRYFGAVGKAPCVCPRCQYPPPRLEETGRPGQDGIRASLREFGPPDEGLPPGSVDVPNMFNISDEPVGSEILLQCSTGDSAKNVSGSLCGESTNGQCYDPSLKENQGHAAEGSMICTVGDVSSAVPYLVDAVVEGEGRWVGGSGKLRQVCLPPQGRGRI